MVHTYPGAAYRPLGAQTEPAMTGHDIVCLHTMVGFLSSTDTYFRATNGAGYTGTESHFGVGGIWGSDAKSGLDGTVWQWQSLTHQADANLDGARTVISIETADNAARPIQPWSPRQLDALARLLAWLASRDAHAACPPSWQCHREGIPLTLIPDTLPRRRGVGYHRQGCPPHIVPGGVAWSTSSGKDCPTTARIAQIAELLELARSYTPHEEEDIMATLDELRAVLRTEVMDAVIARQGDGVTGETTLRSTLAHLDGNLSRIIGGQDPARLTAALGAALKAQGVEVVDLDKLAADVASRLTVTSGA